MGMQATVRLPSMLGLATAVATAYKTLEWRHFGTAASVFEMLFNWERIPI